MPGIRTLYITGYSEQEVQEFTGSPGQILSLSRPVDMPTLVRKVREALRAMKPGNSRRG